MAITSSKCCSKCKTWKLVVEFSKNRSEKDGLHHECKECCNVIHKKYRGDNKKQIAIKLKQWREDNKKQIAIKLKQWYKNNKEQVAIKHKQRYENNKEQIAIKYKQWYENNKEQVAIKNKQRYENNKEKVAIAMKQWRQSPVGKLLQKKMNEKKLSTCRGRLNQRMSIAINCSLKRKGTSKEGCHWETLVGYRVSQLKSHLEKQFIDGMSWNNYGKWHIDHKRPIISFGYDCQEHYNFKKCWALKNLQPLWAKENISKGAKLNWERVNG